MATMYSLFFGVLFTVVCSDRSGRNSVLDVFKSSVGSGFYSLYQGRDFHLSINDLNYFEWMSASQFFLDEKTKQKNQGLVAHPKFNLCSLKIKTGTKWSSAKLNSPDLSGSNSLIFLTRSPFKFLTVSQPRPIYSATTGSYVHLLRLSPAKFLTIVGGCTSFVSKVLSDEFFASFFAENDEVLIHSFENKHSLDKKEEPCHGSSGIKRDLIIQIASKELGIREATGNNDGSRVEEYLRYTNLSKGYDWCSAFVSWCYGKAGLSQPRNPWSPALFPKARQIQKDQCQPADVFGIYGINAKRINHVGLVKELSNDYLITIEGNSNNRVESRRRHLRTVYAIANWVN